MPASANSNISNSPDSIDWSLLPADNNSTAPHNATTPCPAGEYSDGTCRTVWPFWVEVTVPILCIIAFIIALIIIYFKPNKPRKSKASEEEGQALTQRTTSNGGPNESSPPPKQTWQPIVEETRVKNNNMKTSPNRPLGAEQYAATANSSNRV